MVVVSRSQPGLITQEKVSLDEVTDCEVGMFSISLEEYSEVPSCDPSSPQPSNQLGSIPQNQQFTGEIT